MSYSGALFSGAPSHQEEKHRQPTKGGRVEDGVSVHIWIWDYVHELPEDRKDCKKRTQGPANRRRKPPLGIFGFHKRVSRLTAKLTRAAPVVFEL